MEHDTVEVYERRATEWAERRGPGTRGALDRFVARIPPDAHTADLGCGPGWHADHLPEPVVALDAAHAMLRLACERAPGAAPVRAELEALPFRAGVLGAIWAQKCYLHVPETALPLALWDLHRASQVGAPLDLLVLRPVDDAGADEFAGRFFAHWEAEPLADVVEGAGFGVDAVEVDGEWLRVQATRTRTLADTVGPGMRLLVVGLNPSEYAADAGVGFARPGNRFWPAALRAGVVTVDRDPGNALVQHGIGMTDLVKRATPRAGELTRAEFEHGARRVERLVAWLEPAAVCFAGLAGYRAAVDRHATVGWQAAPFGGRPAYVMPSPSGANAHARLGELTAHLAAAAARPPAAPAAKPPGADP
jgi:TDG/mug DNA glycosylase family protein